MLEIGNQYKEEFSISQEKVEIFAKISGDDNPLHLDAEFAASTPFKKPIIHGFLGGSIFSKILGTKFPGPGSVYLKQILDFKRPMFADNLYEAVATIKEVNRDKHTAIIETNIFDKSNGKIVVSGEATILNSQKI